MPMPPEMIQYSAVPLQPMPTDGGMWQSDGCTGTDGCTSCDDCGDCGLPGCACGCGTGSGCWARWLHGSWDPHPARVWGGIEGLWLWNKQRSLPALASTSVLGTPYDQAGVLGQPGTSVLFGGEFDDDASEGIRGTVGLWFDANQNSGVFARGFQFGGEDINFRAGSAGDPILALPFFDVGLPAQDALVIAYPGISRGTLNIQTSNEVKGADVLLRTLLYYGDCNRFDLIGGYQYSEVLDDVRVGHEIVSIDPQGRVARGTRVNTLDVFEAANQFHGGSIGLMTQGFDGRLTWNLLTKVAFGNNRETVTIRGTSTTTIPGGGSSTINQGLLALDTNSGVYERDQFVVLPELDLSVMYNLNSMLSVSIGYTAIYWTDIALATQAVNTRINPTQITGPLIGPPAPIYRLVDDDFWLQGLSFGIHGRY
jgi:hypothetical protein